MDKTALFKLSYGLYVLTAKDGDKDNGCIINTCGQLTDTPLQIQVTVNKNNLTHDMIVKTGVFNVSVLTEEATFWVFQHYGFQSGRDTDKFANLPEMRTENGVRYAACAIARHYDGGIAEGILYNVPLAPFRAVKVYIPAKEHIPFFLEFIKMYYGKIMVKLISIH